MAKCAKRGCNAYALANDKSCLFHTKKRPVSKKPSRRVSESNSRNNRMGIPKRHRDAFDRLFRTEEGRSLLKRELRKEAVSKSIQIPMGLGLQIVSWNYPGYFHQHAYDEIFKVIVKRAHVFFGLESGGLSYVTKAELDASLRYYLAQRYAKTSRVQRAVIGGGARLLTKALAVWMIADLLFTAGRVSHFAYSSSVPTRTASDNDIAKATWLQTIAGM
jgi:hypothetical protein